MPAAVSLDQAFDCIAGIAVGLGLGAYNAASLRPCLADTFHVSRKKSKQGYRAAAPYVKKACSNAGPAARDLYVKGSHAAKKGHAMAMPYVRQLSDAARSGHAVAMPYVKQLSSKVTDLSLGSLQRKSGTFGKDDFFAKVANTSSAGETSGDPNEAGPTEWMAAVKERLLGNPAEPFGSVRLAWTSGAAVAAILAVVAAAWWRRRR